MAAAAFSRTAAALVFSTGIWAAAALQVIGEANSQPVAAGPSDSLDRRRIEEAERLWARKEVLKEHAMTWYDEERVLAGTQEDAATPEFPSEPGCFVRTPYGCPKHPTFVSIAWKHELYGEKFGNAAMNRTDCEVERRAQVSRWCGAADTETLYIANEGVEMMRATPPLGVPEERMIGLGEHRAAEELEIPTEPGCFVRTPRGCPNHPGFSSTNWKHEEYGERYIRASRNETMCEGRRATLARWCGVEDVETLFVTGSSSAPAKPGCYVRTPAGCKRHPSFSSRRSWKREEFGEMHTYAKVNRTVCEVVRKEQVDAWCGTKSAEMLFVPGTPLESVQPSLKIGSSSQKPFGSFGRKQSAKLFDLPREPGCFVRTPSGCPNHAGFGSSVWRHERYGEQHMDAKNNQTACEVARKVHVQHYCGADDVELLFVPPLASDELADLLETAPTEPGCHVATPSGCPNHPDFFSSRQSWAHDIWGETYTQAMYNRTACEDFRGSEVREWCGAPDVLVKFIPGDTYTFLGLETESSESANSVSSNHGNSSSSNGANSSADSSSNSSNNSNNSNNSNITDDGGADSSGATAAIKDIFFAGNSDDGSASNNSNRTERFPADPMWPGCYVWMPTGCRKHPEYRADGWRRELFGELFAGAAKDKTLCEVHRKRKVNKFCGIGNTRTKYIGEMEAAQHEASDWKFVYAGAEPEGILMMMDDKAEDIDTEALMLASRPLRRI